MSNLKQTIVEMLTENTGKHFLDSGGIYGRHWQRNAGKGLDEWESQPSATLEVEIREWRGKPTADLIPTVSVYHVLTGGSLELDDICKEYNAMPVDDWRADIHGVSHAGLEWLENMGFKLGDPFNSYNWDNHLSQVVQGHSLTRDGERYVLLQIHNGADVRGGYTDARLFKLHDSACDVQFLLDDCGFSVEDSEGELINLDWYGEWINSDGGFADDDDLLAFACAAKVAGERVIVQGDAYTDF